MGDAHGRETDRYVALDGLRGVAAIGVAGYHAAALAGRQFVPGGYLAVDLFFALSGFVIAHAYDARLRAGLSTARFVRLRLVRFWPLYLLGLALGCLHQLGLTASHNPFALGLPRLAVVVTAGLFFMPTAFGRDANLFPLNIPSWSLFVELLVNAGFAAARGGGADRRLSDGWLVAFAVAGLALLVPICLSFGSADLGARPETIAGGLTRALFSFPIGVLIYRYGARSVALPFWLLAAIVVIALCVPVPPPARSVYDLVFIVVLSPLLLLFGSGTTVSKSIVRGCTVLGSLSYALYAIHRPLFALAAPLAKRAALPPALTVTLAVAVAVALAVAADHWLDRPARDWLATRLGTRGDPTPPEATLP